MSMSQEEIEALMNGIDSSDDDEEDTQEVASDDTPVSEDDIDDLIAKTTDMLNSDDDEIDESEDTSVDELISSLKEEDKKAPELPTESDLDDILAGIDGITNTPPKQEEHKENNSKIDEDSLKSWTDSKINEGIFPLPVEKNHKVVNQLSEVANDSEEKASRIFDVLSFILDENSVVQKNTKELDAFIDRQITLYTALSTKFPNISLFKTNLEQAQDMKNKPKEIMNRVNDENNQLFEAMELMQYHDINRQKIERVMSVIRKLATYLNNIFEDDGTHKEVAVAKHIPGDETSDLVGSDDLDALIAEFGK